MKAKKALSLLLVLTLALAIFSIPAAAETYDHDGCSGETVILRRPPIMICTYCGYEARYDGKNQLGQSLYKCTNVNCPYYRIGVVGPDV